MKYNNSQDKLRQLLDSPVQTPFSKPQNRTGIVEPLSAYELMQLNRQQTSPDPVISKFQKLGRGIKGLLIPETPIETLSMIPAVKTAKVALKAKDLVKPGETLSDATQRLNKIKMKKVLVIGSDGNIGKELVKHLRNKKYSVVECDQNPGWRKDYYQANINNAIDLIVEKKDDLYR